MQEYDKPTHDKIMAKFLDDFYENELFRVCPQCGLQTVQISTDIALRHSAASCLCCGFYTHETAVFSAKGSFCFDGNGQVIVAHSLKNGYGTWGRLSVDRQRHEAGVFSEFTPVEFKRMLAKEIVDDPSWDADRSHVTDAHPTRPSGYELGHGTYHEFLLGNYKLITWGIRWPKKF